MYEKKNTAQKYYVGCKANLYLRVLSIRKDGYHEIESIFYPLQNPYDVLTISDLCSGQGFQLSCSIESLAGENNILWKAYSVFGQETGFWPDVKIDLEKNIPLGSGLGGGSADAAVFLKYLWKRLHDQKFTYQDLEKTFLIYLARRVGADVPFFLDNRTAWIEGVGEKIEHIPLKLENFRVLVICPELSISTSFAYKLWDQSYGHLGGMKASAESLTKQMEIVRKSFCSTGILLNNSFENVLFPVYPQLREIKRQILTIGASGCVISGSGASLIALVRTNVLVKAIRDWLNKSHINFYLN